MEIKDCLPGGSYKVDEPCPTCGENNWMGVEYGYPSPEEYDGVSEWECLEFGTRIGRWTGKVLKEGEIEKRYGRE
jgi:hypothetical protein